MEDILNILEKITKIRATGTFAGYEPEGRHKNAIYFATDKDEIYFNGKCYSGSSKNEDIASLLEDYVKTSDLEIVEIPSSVYDFNDIIGNRTESTTITQTQFDNIWNYILKAYKINGLIKIKLIDGASIYPYYIFKLEHIMDSPYKQAVFSSYIIKGAGSYNNGSTLNKNYLINHVLEFRSNTDDNSYILFRNLLKQTTGTSTTDVMSQKACTDSFVQKEVGKVLSSNDFTNKDKSKLDSLSNYNDSEILEEIQNINNALEDKVSKDGNKQLSTEDFTTLLKEKLEGLENYDDTEIQAKLVQLKANLDAIIGSDDVDKVINTFREIEAFLQGITNEETLTGLLQDLKSDILALCNNTYVAKTDYTAQDVLNKIKTVDGEDSGLDADTLDGFNSADYTYRTSKDVPTKKVAKIAPIDGGKLIEIRGTLGNACALIYVSSYNAGTSVRFTTKIIYCYPDYHVYINGNSNTYATVFIYNNSNISCSIRVLSINNSRPSIEIIDEVPSDATRVDNDSNNQLATVGGTVRSDKLTTTGEANKIPVINELGNLPIKSITSKFFTKTQINKGWYRVGVTNIITSGNIILQLFTNNFVQKSDCFIFAITISNLNINIAQLSAVFGENNNKIPKIRIIKSGTNYYYIEAYYDGIENNNGICVSGIGNFTTIEPTLVDEEVPEGYTVTEFETTNGFKTSSPINGSINIPIEHNSVVTDTNIPKSISFKQLQNGAEGIFPHINGNSANVVFNINKYLGNDYISQLGFSSNGKIYYRNFNANIVDTTTPWKELAFTDSTVAQANNLSINRLTNEDLNDIKNVNFSTYWFSTGNSLLNLPFSNTNYSGNLIVFGYANITVQICCKDTTNEKNIIYRRIRISSNWSPWKKILTEDDISSLVSRIEALESKIN